MMMATARWVKMVTTTTMATKTARWEAVRQDTTTTMMATVDNKDDDNDGDGDGDGDGTMGSGATGYDDDNDDDGDG